MSTFGATLRVLRHASGLSLRDLARRLGVSSTYLSRVENGVDAVPTPSRLSAMAQELGLPAPLLMDLAHRISPLVVDYVARVPEAGSLFLEIAHRRLDAAQITTLRSMLDQAAPSARPVTASPALPRLSDLLTPERIIVRLGCSDIDDVFAVTASRLMPEASLRGPSPAAALADALRAREAEVSSAVGFGVALPCLYQGGAPPRAALVTLAPALTHDTPDREPLRVVIVTVGAPPAEERLLALASLARLASRGLADELLALDTPAQVLARLRSLETWR